MQNKNLGILGSILAIALLIGGVMLLSRAGQSQPQQPSPSEVQKEGAIPGNNIDGSYFTVGGINYYYGRQTMAATSSSVCVFPNPFGSATSSIVRFQSQISSSSATGIGIAALKFDLSTTTAAGGYGSSTPALIYGHSLAAGAKDSVQWQPTSSSTPSSSQILTINSGATADGSSPFVLGPSEKITYRIASGTPGTFSTYLVGTCNVLIQQF